MNSLAPTVSKPLTAQPADDLKRPLLMLFSAYDPPYTDRRAGQADKRDEARAAAYMLAVSGIPEWAIAQAVTDYIQGRVERSEAQKAKMPTAEQISSRARLHVDQEAEAQQRRRQLDRQREEIRAEQERQAFLATPEGKAEHQRQKERVAKIFEQFKQG